MMEQMCMIGVAIVYPDAFGVVDLIVEQKNFEAAKQVVTEIAKKLEADPDFIEKFKPYTDFVKEFEKVGIDSCVLRVSTDMIDEDEQNDFTADFYIDLDK